tara:strand:- start:1838 stop:2347 length:510 start_codon:yes stop_codon:yes gene_type:complete
MLDIVSATAAHLLSIERDPSQAVQLGIAAEMTPEAAEELCGDPASEAWACFAAGRLVACCGLRAVLDGGHAVAWATLARGIGGAHLAVTRFVRSRVLQSSFARIEAVALANDAEPIVAHFGDLDAQQLIEAVMVRPTRECRFAVLGGLKPAHVLRHYGGATHMLMERIR